MRQLKITKRIIRKECAILEQYLEEIARVAEAAKKVKKGDLVRYIRKFPECALVNNFVYEVESIEICDDDEFLKLVGFEDEKFDCTFFEIVN